MLTAKEKLSAQAQRYIEKGQYERAIREYLKIVAEDEKDVRTWLKVGDLFAKLGQKAEAAQTYQKVARFYSEQGFYLKAVAVYKQILKIDPRLTDVNVALAGLYRQLGLIQDAIAQYETVAAFLQREGRCREAISAHQAILDLDPDNVAQRIKLAELYSKEEMQKEAVGAFSQAAEQLRVMGRFEDFLKVGERLLFHDPDNRAMAKDLATLYLQRGETRRALTKLQPAFKADQTDAETLDLLAQAFQLLGQHQKSVSVLKEMARILVERGQREEASEAYRRILQIDPTDNEAQVALRQSLPRPLPRSQASSSPPPDTPRPRPISQLPGDELVARTLTEADVYAKYGLYQKSIDHLQRALRQQPQLRLLRERLAGYHEAAGQIDAAVAELWNLFNQAPGAEEAASSLGEILRLSPQNKVAIRKLQEMRSRGARSGESGTEGAVRTIELDDDPDDLPSGRTTDLEEDERPLSLDDELSEVSFYLEQGSVGEARRLLEGLALRYPSKPEIRERLARLPPGTGERAVVDVGPDATPSDEVMSGPTFEVTRTGLRQRGARREDGEADFALGLKYQEMGLYGDAVAAFLRALHARVSGARCHRMIGLCLLSQGQPRDAIAAFKQALYDAGAADGDMLETHYWLGRAYEQLPDRKEALYFYEKALKQDDGFRDVRERVFGLRRAS